jgi:branched-chain amino acid transport system substrate-binding protein
MKKMKKIKFLIALTAIVFIFAGFNSCSQGKQKSIKIGVILPLSGELASYGQKILNGIKLAVDDFNNNNSLQVELIVEDDKGENNLTVSAFHKLTNINKVKFVIGTLTSGGTLAIAPLAQKNHIFLISPSASNPKLSEVGSYFYRVWASDNLDGLVSAEYCYNTLKLRKMAISYQNNDYCLGLKMIFEEKFESLGGDIIATAGYNEGENDFKTLIVKLKSNNCDGVYLPGHPIGISSFLKQSKELGFSKTFFANVAAEDKDFVRIAGNSSDGLYYTAPAFDINAESEIVSSFVFNYKSKYHEEPDIFGVKGYESVDVILKAFSHGYLSSSEVCRFIDSTRTFYSIEGNLVFDSNGDVLTAVSIKQYNNSKSQIIKTIHPKQY